MNWSLPGSSVHRILQARILEWVAIPFSKGSSWLRDRTGLLHCRQILDHLSHQGNPAQSLSFLDKEVEAQRQWLCQDLVEEDSGRGTPANHPACAGSPSSRSALPAPLHRGVLGILAFYTLPTDPRAEASTPPGRTLMKHRAASWPQGKGYHCLYRETGRERSVEGGAAGPWGARGAWPQPLILLLSPPAPSSPPFSISPCHSHWLFTYPVYLPNSAQNFRIERNLTGHLNPSFSRCGPQMGSRAIHYLALVRNAESGAPPPDLPDQSLL